MEEQRLSLIKKSESYNLTVTKNLEKKIRFLCEKLPRNEWSGTLFYNVEGSFKDKNLHIICVDFFLQDVGEATYTEFQNDVDLASYIVEHELWDCCTGLLHSHAVMPTFFSGTDLNTLREEGKDANHFVSLIVNNAGKYTAAITRKVKCSQKGDYSISYNTFNDEFVNSENSPFEQTKEYIEYFPLEITVEEIPITPKSELELRLEAVRNNTNSYINKNTTYSPFTGNLTNIPSRENESKKEIYVQKSLFEDEETKVEKIKDAEFEESIDYDNDHINPTIIHNMVMQIITGDIFSTYKAHIDLNKWAENMENLYDRRFSEDEDLTTFSYWAESFIDFLENEVDGTNLKEKGADYIDAIWANDMIEALQKFPENKYLKIFIDSFERWLI